MSGWNIVDKKLFITDLKKCQVHTDTDLNLLLTRI
jgi:hypothetical protein